MDLLTPAVIGIGLSMDCFAVSLAIGTTTKTRLIYAAVIIAIFFGAFQAGMTVIGWLAGSSLIGLISAAYPSADGALTSLTTSFSIDFLGINKNDRLSERSKTKIRYLVHIGFAVVLLFVIILFRAINDRAVID